MKSEDGRNSGGQAKEVYFFQSLQGIVEQNERCKGIDLQAVYYGRWAWMETNLYYLRRMRITMMSLYPN